MEVFDGIIGHDIPRQVLERALEKPQNAYLLIGAEGLGAHVLADRFVRGLVGLDQTRSLSSHPDVAVLSRDVDEDGIQKSNISVDAVRELRERMSRRPVMAPRVVAYIPDADRLNEAGVNALLKSMEEPSAGSVFVLVARHESRLPLTLLSRVVRLPLAAVSSTAIDAWLSARGVSDAERPAAVAYAAGRPGMALRWLEDPSSRERMAEAELVVDRLLSSRSAGEMLAAVEVDARRCEAADDSVAAWQDTLGVWSKALRTWMGRDSARVLGLGHVMLAMQRHLNGPVSPRVWLELGLVRMATGASPVFPTHLPAAYPYPLSR